MTRTPTDAFKHAIQTWEGLYQADPADAGNVKRNGRVIGTMRGVTPAVWARFKRIPLEAVTAETMRAITLDDAAAVYDAFYYRGPGFDRLPWGPVVEVWCDIGWGSGPATAIKQMQRMIGETPDGQIGPRTIERFTRWIDTAGPAAAATAIADWRCDFYRGLAAKRPANAKFLKGWLNRANWYRPDNPRWWGAWRTDAVPLPAPVQQAEAPPKPLPPAPADAVKKEADTQAIVQGGAAVGAAATGFAAILDKVPGWAAGLALLLVVGAAAWAVWSFTKAKRAAREGA